MNANTIVPQRPTETTLDIVTVNVIAQSIKVAQPQNTSLHRAVDKAVARVRAGAAWTLRGNSLEVQSESQPWHFHICTIDACPCQATQGVCWHRALAAITISASTLYAAAAACVPLATQTRRPRAAQPKTEVMEAFNAQRESWRERTRGKTQEELEALVNDFC